MGAAQIDQTGFQHSAFMKASAKTRAMGSPGAPQLQNDSYSLPSHDALAQILPHYLQNHPLQEPVSPAHSDLQSTSGKRLSVCVSEEDPCTAPVTAAVPAKEVQRYRDAMGRMAADMISLRTQMVALQTENSRLRSLLVEFEDPGLELLRDTDLDVMTKAEMADRIASLSCRLSCERSQSAAQSDRIERLQNQLIRKNDSEKELLKLKTVLQRQPGFVQEEQRRMRELEATVRNQGKVIERMERAQQSYNAFVKNKPKGNVSLARRKAREMRPAAENTGLREERCTAPQPPTLPAQPQAPRKETATMRERLDILAELERTETRRHILEQQLEENSKLWGKQKQQMLIQLNEHKHGLHQTSIKVSQ